MTKFFTILIFSFFLYLFSYTFTFAQKTKLDSLQEVLTKQPEDSTQFETLMTIVLEKHQQGDYIGAINICKQALEFAKKIKYPKGEGDAAHRLGSLYVDRGKHDEALTFLLQAVEIRQKIDDKKGKARSLNNIGAVYQDLAQHDKALVYMKQAIQELEMIGDLYGIALISGNIGLLHSTKQQYDTAIVYITKSLALRKSLKDKQGEAYALNYLGSVYSNKKQLTTALTYYLEALAIEEEIKEYYLLVFSYYNIGELYFKLGKFDLAKNNFNKSESIAKQIGATKELVKVYLAYSKLDSVSRDFQGAYEWHKLHKQFADSIFNTESSKKIADLQSTFDVAKKEKEIYVLSQEMQIQKLTLNRQKWLLGGFGLAMLVVAFVGYVFYRNKQLKAMYELLQKEQQVYRLQMNPHFFFNALVAIQDFVLKADGLKATSYIAKFSRLMRQTLEQSQQEFTKLSTEIEMITYYLDLQQLRFSGRFQYQIVVDDELNPDEVQIPIMLMQPVIENAIEHGLKTSQEGKINISFKLAESFLVIDIEDNGIGRLKSAEQKAQNDTKHTKHISMATKILANRIELLEKQANFKLQLQIIDKSHQPTNLHTYQNIQQNQESGTIVRFLMPIKYNSYENHHNRR
jgi:tetratricopeptide (TPR) repeat protein